MYVVGDLLADENLRYLAALTLNVDAGSEVFAVDAYAVEVEVFNRCILVIYDRVYAGGLLLAVEGYRDIAKAGNVYGDVHRKLSGGCLGSGNIYVCHQRVASERQLESFFRA